MHSPKSAGKMQLLELKVLGRLWFLTYYLIEDCKHVKGGSLFI